MATSATLLLACLLAACTAGHAQPPGDSPEAIFSGANQLYDAGQYARAAQEYERCLQQGAGGADVLFNLGNAYAQQKQLGRALAAYSAAQRLAPGDADVRANCQSVEARRAESAPQIPRSWFATVAAAVLARFTAGELTVALLLMLLVSTALGVALLRLADEASFVRSPRRIAALLAASGALLICFLCATVARARADAHPPAFICARAAALRSGPGEHFEDTGALNDGAQVEMLSPSGAWTEVLLPTGKRAWVRTQELACR